MKILNSFKNIRPCFKNNKLTSSNGTKSFFADLEGVTFKVYECQNSMQLKLRKYIARCKTVSSFFPKIFNVFEKELLVIEEFIEGNQSTPKDNIKQDIDRLIKNLKKIKFPKTWDYIDHIHKRVNLNKTNISIEPKVNHNDLTYANIIIDKLNHPIVIDNEFLACNDGWFMNKFNSDIFYENDYPAEIPQDTFVEICKIRKSFKK